MSKDLSIPLLALIAVAGACGTLLRWGVALAVERVAGGDFPWGTFVVNMAGCLMFGVVVALAEDKQWISHNVRLVALTGFMGAFTTFSTFAYDTSRFYRDGAWLLMMANLASQNVFGVACVLLGVRLGQLL